MSSDPVSKIQSRHLQRRAFVYVRQSSMRQVMENTESTQRQYNLRQRAVALGWSSEQIVVIDSDLGQSGASAVDREGFQHLVTEVGMGRAGIVMGLEVSRLARNSTDWHRLLEICAVTDTLILDEDGTYDPSQFNDRLLLGLKGTMSEAELHVLKARLRGGIINKARRGEYRSGLPIGFAYDDQGNVALDPDLQVQQSVRLLFESFRRSGSAYATVRLFHQQGLLFPRRYHAGPLAGELTFSPLTTAAVLRALHNPRYAGAYFFGRRRTRRDPEGRTRSRQLEPKEWTALIPDAHARYIEWNEFDENQARLRDNDIRHGMDEVRASPPREGSALLQGLAICGRCGHRLSVRYHTRGGVCLADYVCVRSKVQRGEPTCQSVAGRSIEAAISKLVTDVVTPATIEVALLVQQELQQRIDDADRLRLQSVKRAQYEADLARRRFMRVDPDNRLVADSLEAEWNAKLRLLSTAHDECERQRQADRLAVDPKARERVLSLAVDFPRLWRHPATPNRERKRMLALLVEDVTLLKAKNSVKVCVRFKGGRCETLEVAIPKNGWQAVLTPAETIAEMDRLLEIHTYEQAAQMLNERGLRPGARELFDAKTVIRLARDYRLRSRFQRLRARGLLTKAEIMRRLDVSKSTLRNWAKHGLVVEHRCDGRAFLYDDPGPDAPSKQLGHNATLVARGRRQQEIRLRGQSDQP